MKKHLLLSVAATVAATGAFAADLPSRKAPPIMVVAAPTVSWTGFYAGVNAGYSWDRTSTTDIASSPIFIGVDPAAGPGGGPFANTAIGAATGATGIFGAGSPGHFIGGGQIGYNYQFGQSLVAGLEADIQGLTGGGNGVGVSFGPVPSPPGPAGTAYQTILGNSKAIDYLGTVRGRLGYLVTPTLLFYGTGGLAYGQVSSATALYQDVSSPPGPNLQPVMGGASGSGTKLGWTLGVGGEWKFAENWSVKLEYLYYDLGSQTNSFAVAQVGPPRIALQFINIVQARTRFNGDIVRAGVNYHFNFGGSAPVVAKY